MTEKNTIKLQGAKRLKSIDITPTWQGLAPALFAVLENPEAPPEAKEGVRAELMRALQYVDNNPPVENLSREFSLEYGSFVQCGESFLKASCIYKGETLGTAHYKPNGARFALVAITVHKAGLRFKLGVTHSFPPFADLFA